MQHTFHIPVLGLGYSIDTPLKIARYGISSVVSIVDDELTERMRKFHAESNGKIFKAISKSENDYRARRITSYLDLLEDLVAEQFKDLCAQEFTTGNDIVQYFELLPDSAVLKQDYALMKLYPAGETKKVAQDFLRKMMARGAIDVNIMAKVDKMNYTNGNYLGDENTDALAALRGFAQSKLNSSVVLSAGMNPKLYSYLENFQDFFPSEMGPSIKKIILKVSDFRSALIQAKFLAKKGLWVSEFRIESGLNCGGHAFATEGYLLGPILEEFKQKRTAMRAELFEMYARALHQKDINIQVCPSQRLTVQGGIGTAKEHDFLIRHYGLDATGWGSPFLLVPEATNVDLLTLEKLSKADERDFYLSNSSPLGIRFNNFKGSSIEEQRLERIAQGRPGSPCKKKFLCNNTEFSQEPICTASREYQHLKINQLQEMNLEQIELNKQIHLVTEKVCLCEGLCASTYLKYEITKPRENTAVAICPGPNLAYFNRTYKLHEMVDHIYGKVNVLANCIRPHMFFKELDLYINYLAEELKHVVEQKKGRLDSFQQKLTEGITYYQNLFSNFISETQDEMQQGLIQLEKLQAKLSTLT